MTTEGWSALEAMTGAEPEVPELPRQYRRAFGTPDGAKVLADLYAQTVGRRLSPGCSDADLREHEGRRHIYWYIHSRLQERVE
jgi:hypothetical protein